MNTTIMKFYLLLILIVIAGISFSQGTITGIVADSTTGETITGASVTNSERNKGTITDVAGRFLVSLPPGEHLIEISFMGYNTRHLSLVISPGKLNDLDTIFLHPAVIGLKEVKIIASEATDRKTPIPITNIPALTFERYLGDQPYPVAMKMVPGVYATRTGGGSGDAAVNIRGFKQENVALLLNGIPVNSVENGLVYWNNWIGLGEVTEQLQVQRGLGASNVAQNSVGGTINIITKTTRIKKGGSFKYEISSYGNNKATLMLSTGKMKNGLAVTFLGSRFSGPGYVDATYVNGWSYFLTISKDLGKKHKLSFTALGNPEIHGQRNFRLSNEEYQQYGRKYNKDWGSYNGKINNASENFYHKPHFSLNDYWQITEKSLLASSVYLSFGKGGGKWTDTFGDNPWIFSYYNPSGQINWDIIYKINAYNTDTFRLANGQDTTGYSINIQTNFLASHIWTGLLSTLHHEINEHFKLIAGIHGRYFKSKLQQKVRDLLGGGFFIDDYAWAIDGVAGRNQVKHAGDVIKIDNGAMVNDISLFAQLEYKVEPLNVFIAATLNNSWYRRYDSYNYVSDINSDLISKTGFNVKLGANFNIDEFNNIYFNAGYFSKTPYFKFVFGNYTNTPTKNLKNEKTKSFELGYGWGKSSTRFKVNGYYILWEDKSILTNEYNQFEDPSMISGLDALHTGIEMEIRQRIGSHIQVGGIFSLGEWKWQNDVMATIFDNNNVAVDTVQVYADGLYVGDAPQTQVGLFAGFHILRMFDLSANWVYYDRMYADFSPTTRNDPADRSQSYRAPSYQVLDLFLGYPFELGTVNIYASMACYNVLNSEYIVRGRDGASHDLDDFRGFWAFGRNFNFSIRIGF